MNRATATRRNRVPNYRKPFFRIRGRKARLDEVELFTTGAAGELLRVVLTPQSITYHAAAADGSAEPVQSHYTHETLTASIH